VTNDLAARAALRAQAVRNLGGSSGGYGGGNAAPKFDALVYGNQQLQRKIAAIVNSDAPGSSKSAAADTAKHHESGWEKFMNVLGKPKSAVVASIARIADPNRNWLKDVQNNVGTADVLANQDWFKDLPGAAKFGIGLTGDILADPLTYLTASPAIQAIGGAKGAAKLAFTAAEAATDVEKAAQFTRLGQKAAKGISKLTSAEKDAIAALGVERGLMKEGAQLGGVAWRVPGSKLASKVGILDEAKSFKVLGQSDALSSIPRALGKPFEAVRTSAVGESIGRKLGGDETKQALKGLLRNGTPEEARGAFHALDAWALGSSKKVAYAKELGNLRTQVLKEAKASGIDMTDITKALNGDAKLAAAVDAASESGQLMAKARAFDDAVIDIANEMHGSGFLAKMDMHAPTTAGPALRNADGTASYGARGLPFSPLGFEQAAHKPGDMFLGEYLLHPSDTVTAPIVSKTGEPIATSAADAATLQAHIEAGLPTVDLPSHPGGYGVKQQMEDIARRVYGEDYKPLFDMDLEKASAAQIRGVGARLQAETMSQHLLDKGVLSPVFKEMLTKRALNAREAMPGIVEHLDLYTQLHELTTARVAEGKRTIQEAQIDAAHNMRESRLMADNLMEQSRMAAETIGTSNEIIDDLFRRAAESNSLADIAKGDQILYDAMIEHHGPDNPFVDIAVKAYKDAFEAARKDARAWEDSALSLQKLREQIRANMEASQKTLEALAPSYQAEAELRAVQSALQDEMAALQENIPQPPLLAHDLFHSKPEYYSSKRVFDAHSRPDEELMKVLNDPASAQWEIDVAYEEAALRKDAQLGEARKITDPLDPSIPASTEADVNAALGYRDTNKVVSEKDIPGMKTRGLIKMGNGKKVPDQFGLVDGPKYYERELSRLLDRLKSTKMGSEELQQAFDDSYWLAQESGVKFGHRAGTQKQLAERIEGALRRADSEFLPGAQHNEAMLAHEKAMAAWEDDVNDLYSKLDGVDSDIRQLSSGRLTPMEQYDKLHKSIVEEQETIRELEQWGSEYTSKANEQRRIENDNYSKWKAAERDMQRPRPGGGRGARKAAENAAKETQLRSEADRLFQEANRLQAERNAGARAYQSELDGMALEAEMVANEAEMRGLETVARLEANQAVAQANLTRYDKELSRLGARQEKFTAVMDETHFVEAMENGFKKLGMNTQGPEQLVDALTTMARMSDPKEVGLFLKTFDKLESLFKVWAIATPGFQARNFFGDSFNNYLAGVDFASYKSFHRADSVFRRAVKAGATNEEALARVVAERGAAHGNAYRTAFESYGMMSVGQSGAAGVESGLTASSSQGWAGIKESVFGGGTGAKNIAINNPVTRLNMQTAEEMAHYMRGTLAFDTALKGGDKFDAINNIFKYQFNYDDLSQFEQGVMKRVNPFYTWTRKNLPLQIEMLIRKPKVYAHLGMLQDNIQNLSPQEDLVPSWFGDMGGIRLPFSNPMGERMYMMPNLPMQDLNKLMNPKAVLGEINPLLKMPVEMLQQKQLYNGQEFRKGFVEVPKTWEQLGIGKLLEMAGQAHKGKDGQLQTRDSTLYALESFMPLLGRTRRALPSEEKYQRRAVTSWMSMVLGLSFRSNTVQDQAGELYRRNATVDKINSDLQSLGYGGYRTKSRDLAVTTAPSKTDKSPYLMTVAPKGGLPSGSPYTVADKQSKYKGKTQNDPLQAAIDSLQSQGASDDLTGLIASLRGIKQ
jgi:hypothetical protein